MNIDFYKNEIEKTAGLVNTVVGAAKTLAPKALGAAKSFTGSSLGKRVAIGSGVGALGNGLTYNGNDGASGRVKSMVGGAVNGGIIGGALSSKNVASAGTSLSSAGKKLSTNAGKWFGEGAMGGAATNAGNFASNAGNKINSMFDGQV